jgi:phosphate transport system substrate-binding protein
MNSLGDPAEQHGAAQRERLREWSHPNCEGGRVRFQGSWRPIFVLALVQIGSCQNPEKIPLVGVGTTSPLAVYSIWFHQFEKTRPDVQFSYIPSGSETGVDMVTSGTADFGATDVPMTQKELAKAKVHQFATVLVTIAPVYNVPEAQRPLRFSPQALAGIYLGKITRWNDPAISGPNPGVQLPASNIAVIHSADGRGATYIWSDYLSKVSVEWKGRVGRGTSIQWPVGKEANGNGNLARMVKQIPYSIGYVELVYAVQNRLQCGDVQNAAGNFVAADLSSIAAAAEAVSATPSGFHSSITNPPGEKAYPISSFTWMLVSEKMESTAKERAVKKFLRWILNEGQTYVQPAGFARLPKAMVEQELKEIEKIP